MTQQHLDVYIREIKNFYPKKQLYQENVHIKTGTQYCTAALFLTERT
jgi:hypothetical protein